MNSSKPWRKGVLVSCVALILLCGAVPAFAQDPDFVQDFEGLDFYILNPFTAASSWDHLDVSFWTSEEDVNYTVTIYETFDIGSGPSGNFAGGSGIRVSDGYGTVTFSGLSERGAGTYFAFLSLDNSQYAVTANGESVSYYSDGSDMTEWLDLHSQGHVYLEYVDGGPLPPNNNLKFILDAVPSMGGAPQPNIWVNQTQGNWDIESEQFDGTATLAVDIKANDYGPFDTEIGVQGGMNPIFIDGQIFNDTGEDWPGMVLQLGYGLGGDFVLATDVFFTDGTNFMNELVIGDTIRNGEWESFDQPIPIVLPQGADDPFFFTLRAYAIPEPGTLLLLAFAALGLLAFRRR